MLEATESDAHCLSAFFASLIFDAPKDGGLRISHETDTYEKWLNDLKADIRINIEQKYLVIDVMNGFAREQESEIRETVGCTEGS